MLELSQYSRKTIIAPPAQILYNLRKTNQPNRNIMITEQDLFYANLGSQNALYSYTPSNIIDPQRLISGAAPFKRFAPSSVLEKKTILLPPLDIQQFSEQEKEQALCRLRWLMSIGFDIYACKQDGSFFKNSFYEIIFSQRPAFAADLSKYLQREIDAIISIPAADYKPFILGSFDELNAFFPFTHINLEYSSISAAQLQLLLQNYGSRILHLQLGNTVLLNQLAPERFQHLNNIAQLTLLDHYISPAFYQTVNFKKLKKFRLSGTRHTGEQLLAVLPKAEHIEELYFAGSFDVNTVLPQALSHCSSLKHLRLIHASSVLLNLNTLQLLSYQATALEELSIGNCPNLHATAQAMVNYNFGFKNLRKFNAARSSLKTKTLLNILGQTNDLEELDISFCYNIKKASSQQLSLKKLKKFAALDTQITTNLLLNILSLAKDLVELNIESCHELHGTPTSPVCFKNLKTVTAGSTINSKLLTNILAQAEGLQEFYLVEWHNEDNAYLTVPKLPLLSFLNIEDSNVPSASLHHLLCQAPNIRELHLTNHKLDGELGAVSLPNLRVLQAAYSTISYQSLNTLLLGAQNLEELDLDSCKNLSTNAISHLALKRLKTLYLRYTNLPLKIAHHFLSQAEQLEKLYIGQWNLTNSSAAQVRLQHLKLLDVMVSTLTTEHLNCVLSGNTSLTQLNIYNCPYVRVEQLGVNQGNFLNLSQKSTYQDYDEDNEDETANTLVPMPCSANITPQHAIEIDSDTSPYQNHFQLKRHYLGRPITPDPTKLRLAVYTATAADNPFILIPQAVTNTAGGRLVARNGEPLDVVFQQTIVAPGINLFFGKFDMLVGSAWALIPSVSPSEEMLRWYTASNLRLEVRQIGSFYYIKALEEVLHTISLEVLVNAPVAPRYSVDDLPAKVQELVQFFRGFTAQARQDKIARTPYEHLHAIIQQQVGACRHRAVAFKQLMQQHFPMLPVQIIANEAHMYVEVWQHGCWITCDLGGYPTAITMKEQDKVEFNKNAVGQHVADSSALTLSPNGRGCELSYFATLQQLTTLNLNGSLAIPQALNLTHLKKLNLFNCIFSAHEFHALLQKTPQLTTLTLCYAQINTETFMALNLSLTPLLQKVHLVGDFIPDSTSLKAFMSQHPNAAHITWRVESANLLPASTEKLEIIRARPTLPPRYALQSKIFSPSEVLSRQQSFLITSANPLDTAYAIQKICLDMKKPYFFVHDREQLKCSRPFIHKQGMLGLYRKGPGGPLYDFIKHYPAGILLIDYSRFNGSDIAQFNSLFDSIPKVDGVTLANPHIIGLINPSDPKSYNGADFYSRFQQRGTLAFTAEPNPASAAALQMRRAYVNNEMLGREVDAAHIKLAGPDTFAARLHGHWVIGANNQFTFKEGQLAQALAQNPKRIILHNPPLHHLEFVRFVRDWQLNRPHGPQLEWQSDDYFTGLKGIVIWSAEPLPTTAITLNSATLNTLLGRYDLAAEQKICLQPGIIEQTPATELSLYLVSSLSLFEWVDLLESAQQHQKKLLVHTAPGIRIPPQLVHHADIKPKIISLQPHTQWFINPPPQLPAAALFIEVSELEPSALFDSIMPLCSTEQLNLSFVKKHSVLHHYLAEEKTVVLKGSWPEDLAQTMQELIIQRAHNPTAPGTLILISDAPSTFLGIIPTAEYDVPAPAKNRQQTIPFSQRMIALECALRDSPIAFLSGATGVGKTYFMQNTWQQRHCCFYGEQAVKEWLAAESKAGEYLTLFIDEANITGRHWSEFQGLFNARPALFYQQRYYLLSPQHKVVFAGNPKSYGGERTQPKLFDQPHPILEFTAIPLRMSLESLALPAAIKEPLLEIVNQVDALYPHRLILTPRESRMMGMLAHSLSLFHSEQLGKNLALQVAYTILASHLSEYELQRFKPAQAIQLSPKLHPCNFVITPNMQPALETLYWHMALRQAQIAGTVPALGGLGGLVFEGPPGIGKSELIMQMWIAQRYKEGQDFYYIPVSLDYAAKEERLLQAFHAGAFALVDEINSSPMLERLLNALLAGHDLTNKIANRPGFRLIGTQNPISMQGRKATTLALQHRLQHVYLKAYSTEEIHEILIQCFQMPSKIALDMQEEYNKNLKKNPQLCFRDLLKWASIWQEQHKRYTAIELPLVTAVVQVGSTCKITALANVELYFAQQGSFKAIPLHKRGEHGPSVRNIAKQLGSVQGEILEFNLWQKTLNALGYFSQCLDFGTDFNLFLYTIIQQLQQGNLPLIVFAVDNAGQPDPEPTQAEKQEHAAVISGYNPHTDQLTLVHWQAVYQVDAVSLFRSNQALAVTRQRECYTKNADYEKHFNLPKYLECASEEQALKKSIIPQANSGFKAKMLIAIKPCNKELFLMHRGANPLTCVVQDRDSEHKRKINNEVPKQDIAAEQAASSHTPTSPKRQKKQPPDEQQGNKTYTSGTSFFRPSALGQLSAEKENLVAAANTLR